jgi:hypothetical protein
VLLLLLSPQCVPALASEYLYACQEAGLRLSCLASFLNALTAYLTCLCCRCCHRSVSLPLPVSTCTPFKRPAPACPA